MAENSTKPAGEAIIQRSKLLDLEDEQQRIHFLSAYVSLGLVDLNRHPKNKESVAQFLNLRLSETE